MAVLSLGIIVTICCVAVSIIVFIVLYCVCRSKDPLIDHTCVARLFPSAPNAQHMYIKVPHKASSNGKNPAKLNRKASRGSTRGSKKKYKYQAPTVEFRSTEQVELQVSKVNLKDEKNVPEKCPLSIDKTDAKEKEKHEGRNSTRRIKDIHYKIDPSDQQTSRRSWSTEHRDPKDREKNERTRSAESRASKGQRDTGTKGYSRSRSEDVLDRHGEDDTDGSHYLRPRLSERGDKYKTFAHSKDGTKYKIKDSHHSSLHYVRPRSAGRDNSHQSSSHYVRPRSTKRDVATSDSHQSSSTLCASSVGGTRRGYKR